MDNTNRTRKHGASSMLMFWRKGWRVQAILVGSLSLLLLLAVVARNTRSWAEEEASGDALLRTQLAEAKGLFIKVVTSTTTAVEDGQVVLDLHKANALEYLREADLERVINLSQLVVNGMPKTAEAAQGRLLAAYAYARRHGTTKDYTAQQISLAFEENPDAASEAVNGEFKSIIANVQLAMTQEKIQSDQLLTTHQDEQARQSSQEITQAWKDQATTRTTEAALGVVGLDSAQVQQDTNQIVQAITQ